MDGQTIFKHTFPREKKALSRYLQKCDDLDMVDILSSLWVSLDDTKCNAQLLSFLNNDDELFTGERALTNTQRMCIENNGQTFDITSRFQSIYQSQETCEDGRA